MNSLFLLIFSLTIVSTLSITLDGIWQGTITYPGATSAKNSSTVKKFSGKVPGGIYTDLEKAKIIKNNLIGRNDIENRWVGNQSVTYSTTFHVTYSLLEAPKILLIFHGVDTFSRIFINDHEIGKTESMFIRYTFEVKSHLKLGDNVLKVAFDSPVKVAEALFNKQATKYTVPPVCVPKEYNGECHVNHIRKMQASFSWDWGPAFPSMGIWKSVELIPINEVELLEISTEVAPEGNIWNVGIEIFLRSAINDKLQIDVISQLHLDDGSNISTTGSMILYKENIYPTLVTNLYVPEERIKRWWPNGYGEQNLYKLTVTVKSPKSISEKHVRIGFRTIELIEEPLNEGRTFYFRVNDIPIFAKGSNFIPASIFPERTADEETIRHLLEATKETHMNMLRVWGGGIYESELFYDLADEYGIMIWQDFMFACAMYPTTKDFIDLVTEEIIQNMRRLKNHASIALWAGNNENEAALYGNWYGTGSAKIYREDYVKLYADVIKNTVEQMDSVRPFVVSSPGNGIYAAEYNYTGKNPYSKLYGDVHYYDYLKNSWDVTQYPRARFSSEYGFQSLPSLFTMRTATQDKVNDMNVDSNFMNHRQHQPHGKVFMKYLITRNFKLPSSNDSLKYFEHYIYLSQINQAVAQRIQTEFYRQAKSDINNVGEGMTMGALYWQLNDVWQAPSWSSIDINGRWKMLQYYAADFFAPIIITSYLSHADDVSIFVVSDLLHDVVNCTARISIYRWNSTTPVHSEDIRNIRITANKSTFVHLFWLNSFLEEVKCGSLRTAKQNCFIKLTLYDGSGVQIAPANYIYPTPLISAKMKLAPVSMVVEQRQLPGKYSNYPDFSIKITTKGIALFVWLETATIRGRFSENGFHMIGEEKLITFHTKEATTPAALQQDIKVLTLYDVYTSK